MKAQAMKYKHYRMAFDLYRAAIDAEGADSQVAQTLLHAATLIARVIDDPEGVAEAQAVIDGYADSQVEQAQAILDEANAKVDTANTLLELAGNALVEARKENERRAEWERRYPALQARLDETLDAEANDDEAHWPPSDYSYDDALDDMKRLDEAFTAD